MSIKDAANASARQSTLARPDGERVKATLKRPKYGERQFWSFGFRYFKEIKNFGLNAGDIDKQWPLSVIYRLSELSGITLASVLEDHVQRSSTLRIHPISWDHKKIPIALEDLDWISKEYLENQDEFPLMQIAVSKAEGRLVGFLDESNVFQIVLLDPLHNAQPAKFNDYKVRLSYPLGCEVTAIRAAARAAIARISEKGCGCSQELEGALTWSKSTSGFAVVMPLLDHESTVLEDADSIINDFKIATSYREIFESGVYALLANHEATKTSKETTSGE